MKKEKSWIDETESLTYIEINRYLTNETAECLRRCQNIAGDQEEISDTNSSSLQTTATTVEGNFSKSFDKIQEVIANLVSKQTDQEKQIEALTKQIETDSINLFFKFMILILDSRSNKEV